MIIENEFSVAAGIDAVWRELLDMEGVASCLPGATISATDRENVYDGTMRLKLGPLRVEYRGTATLAEVDEDSHTAVIALSAREAKGQGGAMATIRNRLESVPSGTRVLAQTDLHITGPQAQFGRGVIEDVGRRVLSEFSERLEHKIAGAGAAATPGPEAPVPGTGDDEGVRSGGAAGIASERTAPEAVAPALPPAAGELDVGSLVSKTPAVRIGAAVALLALLLIVLRRRWGRQSG